MRFPTPPRQSYPSDLTDDQWSLLERLLPSERTDGLGRPREVDLREVINGILYLLRSGCQWDMLPHDLPPKSTTYEYFGRWREKGDGTKTAYFRGYSGLPAGCGGDQRGARRRGRCAASPRTSDSRRSAETDEDLGRLEVSQSWFERLADAGTTGLEFGDRISSCRRERFRVAAQTFGGRTDFQFYPTHP